MQHHSTKISRRSATVGLAALLLGTTIAPGCISEDSSSNWVVLDVRTFDAQTRQGVLGVQAAGGSVLDVSVIGGTVRGLDGSQSSRLCVETLDELVYKIPFTLSGDSAVLSASLYEAGSIAEPQVCDDPQGCPDEPLGCIPSGPLIQTGCCILPEDCGCGEGQSVAPGSTGGSSSSSTGSTADQPGEDTIAIDAGVVLETEGDQR